MDEIYDKRAKTLIKVIDIAISSIQLKPPNGFNESSVKQFINSYEGFKNDCLNPREGFKNMYSLRHIENDIFTYFQEAKGETVDYFWEQIKNADLPFFKKDKLKTILKNKQISDRFEYDFVKDVIGPADQLKLLTKKQLYLLNDMLHAYESQKLK